MDKILSPIKERILKYLESNRISRESFYRETGISASNFKGSGLRSELGGDKIAKILTIYPRLNPDWLLTGRGDMEGAAAETEAPVAYPAADETEGGRVSDIVLPLADPDEMQSVPLYELDPAAGLAELLRNPNAAALRCRLVLPGLPPCDGALRIAGDAMDPLLKSGDIVLYKTVGELPECLLWGEMYLLSFVADGEEYTALRYVQRGDDDAHVRLVSHNPHHASKEIPVASLRAAALVRASVRYNTMI